MKGFVDERDRALIPIRVANKLRSDMTEVVAWIDTAFDGHLVFSRELIKSLKLESLVETEAILADGSKVSLESFFLRYRLVRRESPGPSHRERGTDSLGGNWPADET